MYNHIWCRNSWLISIFLKAGTLWQARWTLHAVSLYTLQARTIFTFTSNYGPESKYAYIYIYIYVNPPKPTVFDFSICFTMFFVGVCLQKQPACFHAFEDFGCLIMMSHDASCVDTMTYFDGMCSVFGYRIVFPIQGFNSNVDRMRTPFWQMSILSFTFVFSCVFIPFLRHIKFWILYAFRSCRHIILWSIW